MLLISASALERNGSKAGTLASGPTRVCGQNVETHFVHLEISRGGAVGTGEQVLGSVASQAVLATQRRSVKDFESGKNGLCSRGQVKTVHSGSSGEGAVRRPQHDSGRLAGRGHGVLGICPWDVPAARLFLADSSCDRAGS